MSQSLHSEVIIHVQALQTNVRSFHCSTTNTSNAWYIINSSNLSIQEYFFFSFFKEKSRLGYRIIVVNSLLIARLLIVSLFLLISTLVISFAKEKHLTKALGAFEDTQDFFILEVKVPTRIHKSTIAKTVFLHFFDVCISYVKGFLNFIILKFHWSLSCAILNLAQNLKNKLRIFNWTPISAYRFIGSFCFAYITFILDFDEIYLCYKANNLHYMSDNAVIWNRLNQLNLCTSLEIIDLVFNLAYYHEIPRGILCLDIDVYVIWHFSKRILDK